MFAVDSLSKVIWKTGNPKKIPNPDTAGFLLMMLVKFNLDKKLSELATDALEVHQQSPGLLKTEVNLTKGELLLVGSRHSRGIGPMLRENLGTQFDICSTFKLNAALAKVVEDLGNCG
jgi:hypothetical protein